MWIALTQTVAPGLEEAFRRVLQSRGEELANLGSRYGLKQIRVFQQETHSLMALEVEDSARFRQLADDPDFQVLAQEMAILMNLQPLRQGQFWPEVFSWESGS